MFRSVAVGEKKLSRFKASWLLLKESWRFLRADSELLLVPVIATIMMVLLFSLLIMGILVSGLTINGALDSWTTESVIFVFGSYLITALVVVYAQAIVTNTVYHRTTNQNATLGQSLAMATKRLPALFVWSVMNASVGVALRAVGERMEWVGRLVTSLLGAAWGVVTYFVVPSIMIDKTSALSAFTKSGSVFKKTWGEVLITNISLGLIFFMFHAGAVMALLGCFFLSTKLGLPAVVMVAGIVYIIWLFVAIALQQVLQSIVVTLLYVYATAEVPPTNFNQELLAAILARQTAQTSTEVVSQVS